MDLATGQLVEVGMAVGLIAAQSIGALSTLLTIRSFHIGGVANGGAEETDVKCKCEGKFVGLNILIELFEARRPREPAVIAEIDGRVELLEEKRRGKRIILVRNDSGMDREYFVPNGKSLRVHDGDRVRAGDALVEGPLVPHDILRVCGVEAAQQYLLREIQNVFRSQRVEIDDKHLEIIVAQMLRKVRVDSGGDTPLLPGSVIDKFEFGRVNNELMNCVKIKDPGDTEFRVGDIVPQDHFDQENLRVEAADGRKAEWIRSKPAAASAQLLGITKAAEQSESFISAASFQETTKVLTETALAGKVDHLVGLKENVILGHLVPVGTGSKAHLEAEVRIRPETLGALADKGPAVARYRDEADAHGGEESVPSCAALLTRPTTGTWGRKVVQRHLEQQFCGAPHAADGKPPVL
jgi:DNA-directed RNA polymerase subunit beta'